MNDDGQVSGLGNVDSVGTVHSLADDLGDPEVISRLDSIHATLQDIHNSNTEFFSHATNSTDLIIVSLGLLLGFVLGYIAVRGFFDSWTNN
jgi:hypothetical protein